MRYAVRFAVGSFVASWIAVQVAAAQERPPLERLRTIPMPGVEGRIDHMAIDVKGHRLFVAALENNTVEVLDLEHGKRSQTIKDLREPQGVAYLAAAKQLVVANGGDGSCRIFDGLTYRPIASLDCKADADNIRFDEHANRVYVGYGKGGLAVIDPAKPARVGDVTLDGHPESFQLEGQGNRIFVNVPSKRQIEVIDRQKRVHVARWPIGDLQANFPMALDEAHHRLLVGCRKPARLVLLDTESGKIVASQPCTGDADDLFYDDRVHRVYVSGGEGSVSVFQQTDADHYRLLSTIPTAPGARTSLFVPTIRRLFVAVPHRGTQQAEIREYSTGQTERD